MLLKGKQEMKKTHQPCSQLNLMLPIKNHNYHGESKTEDTKAVDAHSIDRIGLSEKRRILIEQLEISVHTEIRKKR